MLLTLALACAPEAEEAFVAADIDDCATHFSVAAGYGYESDEMWQLASKSPQTIEDYYCSEDERACVHSNILTREAARCVGALEDLGDDDYDMDLHYRGPDSTLVWVVEALAWGERGSANGWGGYSIDIDAWNENAVLATGEWDQTDCQSGFG